MKRRFPCLFLSLWLGFASAWAADTPLAENHPSDEIIESLLTKATDWQVPQPSPESSLIKLWAYQSDKDYYSLGFVEPTDPGLALIGFERESITRGTEVIRIADPASASLEDITPSSPFSSVHELNTGLITGIQLLRLGHKKTGELLIAKSLGEESGHHRSNFKSPANESPLLMLARSCLAAAMNEITTPAPDFKSIHARIQRLVSDQPTLDTKATQWALDGLEASIEHVPAKPGTMERLIDDYLMSGRTEGAIRLNSGQRSPQEQALILKGFEAVPALLKARNSKRFTNHLMQGFNNFVSYPMSAGQVTNAYLLRLANNELGSNWLRRQQGASAEDDAVCTWWKNASALGEENYVKKHAVTVDKKGKINLSNELLIIADDRYPELLESFYITALKTNGSSGIIDNLLASNEGIPLKRRVDLLKQGVATNQPAHRNSALRIIRGLDPKLADSLLLETIRKAPSTARDEYWLDQDAALGGLTSRSSDTAVWNAIDQLIRKADLGMRMELIDHLAPDQNADEALIQAYLKTLNRYLDDTTVRDNSTDERFDGPGAGFPHDRISMRDYIHTCWATWLKLQVDEPENGATDAQWASYRAIVSQAIASYNDSIGAP